MSIAQGTTHYGYPQVQLTDRPTFADFNPAFNDIDAKLYGLITGASTDHAAIEALQTGLGETNTLLATVKNTADGAKSKADTNEENIGILTTALGNTDRTVATKLDSVAIAEPYDPNAGTYNVGDVVVYNGQRYVCTTAVAVSEPFDADKWTGEDIQTVIDNFLVPVDLIPIWYSVHYTDRKIWLYRIGKIVYYNIATTTDEARTAGPIVALADEVRGVNGIKPDQTGNTQAQRGFMNIVRSGSNIIRECYVSLDTENNRININSEVALENGDTVTLTGYFRTN